MGQDKYFWFGLVPESEKDSMKDLKVCIEYSEYNNINNDLKTLLKGKSLLTDDYSLERRSLEMRINIER